MFSSPQSAFGALGDEHWDVQFPQPGGCQLIARLGANGNVIYASGLRSATSGTNFNICRWDGKTWSDVATASGGIPFLFDFAFIEKALYVGGSFSRINGVLASGLARWDGTNWSAVAGFDGTAYSLAADGLNLYVGGSFTNVGGMPIRFVARWDGTNWFALGSGPNDYVASIVLSGGDVYIGGPFTAAGNVTANRVAKWNGADWSPLGTGTSNGVDGSVYALAANGPDIYVGGNFTSAGGLAAKSVAKWSGSTWSPLVGGISGEDGEVRALGFSASRLYAGGTFTNAGGVRAISLAEWDGTNWSSLGSGIQSSSGLPDIYALTANGPDLYVAGNFTSVGGKLATNLAHWNDKMDFLQPSKMLLTNQHLGLDGRFQFRVGASSVPSYVIEASSNFNSWIPLLTNSITPFDFQDPDVNPNRRFYRTRQP